MFRKTKRNWKFPIQKVWPALVTQTGQAGKG